MLLSVLKILSSLLIPLVLAAILTLINLPLIHFLERRKLPRLLISLTVALVTIVILWVVVSMISRTVNQIIGQQDMLAQQLNRRLIAAISWIDKIIPSVDTNDIRAEINRIFSPGNIASTIGPLLSSFVGGVGSSTALFLLYYIILLSGASGYHAYIDYVMGSDNSGGNRDIWTQTQESISTYVSIKTMVSLATGMLTFLVCLAFGLQFALFWGFVAFLMNYIPSIGSIIATLLPVAMGVIQFDSVGMIVALLTALGLTQFIIGNILDPMLMGSRLKLNTVSVIFGLLFWGYIWGIPGMLLSVPLMVMTRLLLERSESFAIFARIMGKPEPSGRKKFSLIEWMKNRS